MTDDTKKERENIHPCSNLCASSDIDPAIVNFIVHRYIAKLIRRLEGARETFQARKKPDTTRSRS